MNYLTLDQLVGLSDCCYQYKVILLQIFERYNQEVKRIKMCKIDLPINQKYLTRFPFVFLVENAFRNCSSETQLIIENDFIKANQEKWYLKEMSSATYYRKRQVAYEEFISHLL